MTPGLNHFVEIMPSSAHSACCIFCSRNWNKLLRTLQLLPAFLLAKWLTQCCLTPIITEWSFLFGLVKANAERAVHCLPSVCFVLKGKPFTGILFPHVSTFAWKPSRAEPTTNVTTHECTVRQSSRQPIASALHFYNHVAFPFVMSFAREVANRSREADPEIWHQATSSPLSGSATVTMAAHCRRKALRF